MKKYQIAVKGETVATFKNLFNFESCADAMKESRKANGVSYASTYYGHNICIDFHETSANDREIIGQYKMVDQFEEKRRAILADIAKREANTNEKPSQTAKYKTGHWRTVRAA